MKSWMVLATLVAFTPPGHAQHAASASNMALLGHHDLQGRSAYQPVIHEQNGRWIAYVGHHGGRAVNPLTGREEDSGTSIVDVTDPRQPRYLAHIPGEPGQAETGGAQMVRVCSGKDLPKADKSKFYLLRTFGNLAHEVWDVTAPERPARPAEVGALQQVRERGRAPAPRDRGQGVGGVGKKRGGQPPRLRGGGERVAGERVPRAAPDGVHRRRHR